MKIIKSRKGWVGLILGGLLALLTAAVLPSTAGAVTLGNALDFSALSTTGDVDINNVAKVGVAAIGPQGDVAGSNVTLGSNSLAGGDAISSPGNVNALGNFSKVSGECITGAGGAVHLGTGAKCVLGEDTSGTNGKLTVFADAITDVGTFVTALTAATPTETLGPVTLADGKKTTLTDTVAGLNIVEVPSVTLGNSSTLTLSGPAGDTVVLEITGNLKIGSGARILLAGGLTPADVIIYVGGAVTSWGNTTTVNGTILAPNSPIAAGSGAKVTGAIIGNGNVTFLQNATLTFEPSLVDIPTVTPLPITLGDAAGFLAVSTGGNTKLGNVTLANPAAPNSGDIGGNTDTLGSNSVIQGNVVAANGSGIGISLGNFTKVKLACITDGSTVALGSGASCATTDTTGTSPKLALLAGSSADASTFSAEVAGLPVDQSLPAINVAASHSQTLSCGPNPVTVVETPSITLGGSATLKIDCAAGQILAINVTGGALTLGPGFNISLTGGVTANSVVFNVEGISVNPALIGGTSSHFNGTLVAAARACQVNTGAAVNGQLVCGGNVTVGDNLTASYVPLVPIP
jgi:hypothetical protein